MTDFTQKSRTDNMLPYQLMLEYHRHVALIAQAETIQRSLSEMIDRYPEFDRQGRDLLCVASDKLLQHVLHLEIQRNALDKAIRLRMGESQDSVDIPF